MCVAGLMVKKCPVLFCQFFCFVIFLFCQFFFFSQKFDFRVEEVKTGATNWADQKFHSCFVNFQPSDDLFLFFKSNPDQAGCTSDLADSLSAKHNQWRQSCEELAPDL